MLSGINVLVIGVGYFGRHHARIVAALNAKDIPTMPAIENLIITRTRYDRAESVAASIRNSSNCRVKAVIGAAVGNTRQLVSVLKKYRPGLTIITARDKGIGDSIHAEYTIHALKYGAVLCEKPFSHASGDGSSLRYFDDLGTFENAKFFGFELPMAVVSRDMMNAPSLRKIIRQAHRLEFYWEARDKGENNIIDDLALHPWSLLPPTVSTKIQKVDDCGKSARILMNLFNQQTGRNLPCVMTLTVGPGFRGLMADDVTIGIKNDGSRIQLIRLNQPLQQAAKTQSDLSTGKIILEVDNPLEQNIVAALCGQPIVGLRRTYESQLFLETLHGYPA